jgi:hypothetical protein
MSTSNPTSIRPPEGRDLMTAILHLNYSTLTLGNGAYVAIPRHPLVRFVIADLKAAPRPLHWRDAAYSWNAHIRRTRQLAPYSDSAFWGALGPALERGLIEARWDAEWATE